MMAPVILCVDDERMVLDSLREQLRIQIDNNYPIETAESGSEALEIIKELQEDNLELGLIISDHIMPGMKGDELLIAVHERCPRTLKILLTGQADADAVGRAVNVAKLYRYISKPWDATDLAMTVKEALRSYLQDRLLEEQNKQLEEQNIALQQINDELVELNRAFGRFVPHEFLGFLGYESVLNVNLGDQIQRDITMLFSDIRSFTTLSEHMSPQDNFAFINSYLSRVSPIIRQNSGFIDKYLGDGLMALFPETVSDAVQAAVDMQKTVIAYNIRRKEKGYQPIRIGIGLHHGNVMLGTIGEAERMEGTVISDAVNIAFRLEGLTKIYGAAILISEETLFCLGENHPYQTRFLGKVQVKGKNESTGIFEILDGEQADLRALKLQTQADFEQGLAFYYDQEFGQAKACFNRVLAVNPDDRAVQQCLQNISMFDALELPTDWDGIIALTQK